MMTSFMNSPSGHDSGRDNCDILRKNYFLLTPSKFSLIHILFIIRVEVEGEFQNHFIKKWLVTIVTDYQIFGTGGFPNEIKFK